MSILFELCRSYICKLTLYGYIFADYFMHISRAKVYPAKELEHGLRPNSQSSQCIIPTKVFTIQPRYDILYIYKSCPQGLGASEKKKRKKTL